MRVGDGSYIIMSIKVLKNIEVHKIYMYGHLCVCVCEVSLLNLQHT